MEKYKYLLPGDQDFLGRIICSLSKLMWFFCNCFKSNVQRDALGRLFEDKLANFYKCLERGVRKKRYYFWQIQKIATDGILLAYYPHINEWLNIA